MTDGGRPSKRAMFYFCSGKGGTRRPVSRVLSSEGRFFAWMAIHLGRPSPSASRNRPERRRENTSVSGLRPDRPLLFGFAPGGVYPAVSVAEDAVRSYRTLSPLPGVRWPKPAAGRAVCFLWHFPWARARRALPGALFPWSPDFPPPAPGAEGDHPAVWRFTGMDRAPSRQARWATARSSAAVSPSRMPVTAAGRKRRWNARSTAARSSSR